MCAANSFNYNNPTPTMKNTRNLNAKLKVRTSRSLEVKEYSLKGTSLAIGRIPAPSPDICIPEDIISDPHFYIEARNGLYYLIHPHPSKMGTANGFSYQGRKYEGHEKFNHLLSHRDTFQIGGAGETVITIEFDDGSENMFTVQLPLDDIPLRDTTITLGRATDNTIHLDHETISAHHARLEKHGQEYHIIDLGSTNHTYVNKKHVTQQVLAINDEIQIGPFRLLYTGDMLKSDPNRTIQVEAHNLHRIVYKDKPFFNPFAKGKEEDLLKDISFVIPSGAFVALVGGSGAGKSTLLKALSGLEQADGAVFYNGHDYYKSFAAFSTLLGYVPQDDIVHRELTVQQALYYGAKLRLPSDFTESQILNRIETVLKDVELDGKQQSLISKLSGGQRKRVSIALELLANPRIFFLDEPTSGLDPGLDRKMMNLLQKLARRGQTIVLVTHATNNINVCDYVCFMGKGYLVYFGTPNEAKAFFNEDDFADIYNELDDEHMCRQWSEKFHSPTCPDYNKYIKGPLSKSGQSQGNTGKKLKLKGPKRSHPISQFWFLSMRYLALLKNDRLNLGILLLQAPIIALIVFFFIRAGIGVGGFDTSNVVQCPRTAQVFTKVGLPDIPSPSSPAVSKDCAQLEHILKTSPQGKAYASHRGSARKALQDFIVPGPGDAPIILFIMAFSAIMCGCINSSREIVKEDPIYRRERTVNLGILPYLCSKIAVLGVLCLLQSAALVFIISMADPFPHGTFLPGGFEVYITIALTSLTGLMLGLTISAVVPNSDRAMTFLPLLLLPQVIFSGTLFPLSGQGLQIIGMIFPVRWAMAALGSTVGIHADKVFGPSQDGDKLFGKNYAYHGTLFSTYSQADAIHHLLNIWGALGIIFFVLLCFTIAFLKLKDRRK